MNSFYNIDYLIDRIGQRPPHEIVIFDGVMTGNPTRDKSPFQVITGELANMKNHLQHFKQNAAGQFTFFLKNKKGQHYNNAERLLIEVADIPEILAADIPEGPIDQNTVRALVEAELSRRSTMGRIQELEEENQRLKDPAEKLSNLLYMVLEKFAGPHLPLQQPVQGMRRNPNPDTITAEEEGGQDITQEEVENALNWLVDQFGVEGVVSLVEKLQNDPASLQFVHNYANN